MNEAYNLDCMEAMREMPDESFDLAVVDPPYGRKEHGGKPRSGWVRQPNGTRLYVADGHYEKKVWDIAPPPRSIFSGTTAGVEGSNHMGRQLFPLCLRLGPYRLG